MSLILSGSDGVSDIDGSASTPAIRGTDANTGIFFPAADTIAFAEGGAERMRIDSSGNLLVGTTSASSITGWSGSAVGQTIQSAQPVLAIVDSDDTTNFVTWLADVGGTTYLYGKGAYPLILGTSNTERMRIDSSGNVGIGATSLTGKLTVRQSTDATNGGIVIEDTSGGGAVISRLTDGGLTFRNGGLERARITSGGELLVGTTSASFAGATRQFVVNNSGGFAAGFGNTTAGNETVVIQNGDTSGTRRLVVFKAGTTGVGEISSNGTTTTYATSSDYRLKENVAPMTGALAKVLELNPVTYTWKSDGSDGQGFIAHELQEVYPDAVSGEKDGEKMQGVDYGKLTPILTAALQEAITKIETLEARIAVLEAK